jgi:hypothetical protein
MAESNSKSVPIDSLNSILAYLDAEHRRYEHAGDEKRFDPIFGHVANVREWLKPGVRIVIHNPGDGTETTIETPN